MANKIQDDDEYNKIETRSTKKRRTTAEEDSERPQKKGRKSTHNAAPITEHCLSFQPSSKDTRDVAPAREPEDESSESEYAGDEAVEMNDASKATRFTTPEPESKDEGFEVEYDSFYNTTVTRRMTVHSGLGSEEKILAEDMEHLIKVEARGATRKDVPLNIFKLMYLQDFIQMPKSKSDDCVRTENWPRQLGRIRVQRAVAQGTSSRSLSSPALVSPICTDPF